MIRKILLLAVLFILSMSVLNADAQTAATKAPDPSGNTTGTTADITAAKAGAPTTAELSDQVGKNKISLFR